MTVENFYQYNIANDSENRVVTPLNEPAFEFEFERQTGGKNFYSKELNAKILLFGEDYYWLKEQETKDNLCVLFTLEILRKCDNETVSMSTFTLTDCEWDADRCTVEIKVKKGVPSICFEARKNFMRNLFEFVPLQNRVKVNTKLPNVEIETRECFLATQHTNTNFETDFVWCSDNGNNNSDTGDAAQNRWQAFKHVVALTGNSTNFSVQRTTTWARQRIVLACSEVPDAQWIVVEDTCAANQNKTYAAFPFTFGCNTKREFTDEFNNTETFECKLAGFADVEIDNGITLKDALEALVVNCNLTVSSNFFQINPSQVSNINYITAKRNELDNLILFQKSDVKRPKANNNASIFKVSIDQILKMLNVMFNVEYRFSEDFSTLVLEHVSYFSRNAGLDLTQGKFQKWTKGKNKYSYDINRVPASEKWQFKEEKSREWAEFNTIFYRSACVNSDIETNYTLDYCTSDLQHVIANPDADSAAVEDAGFVIVSTKKIGTGYFINVGSSYEAFTGTLNAALSWERLISSYLKFKRPFFEGGVFTPDNVQMLNAEALKKGESLTVPIGCGETFNPDDTITTQVGIGRVEKATFNLQKCLLTLELFYSQVGNTPTNRAPVLNAKTITLPTGFTKRFLLDGFDVDGIVVRSFIDNVFPGLGQIEEVSQPYEWQYSSDPVVAGSISLPFKIIDNEGAESNTAFYNFNVIARPTMQLQIFDAALLGGLNAVWENRNNLPTVSTQDTDVVNPLYYRLNVEGFPNLAPEKFSYDASTGKFTYNLTGVTIDAQALADTGYQDVNFFLGAYFENEFLVSQRKQVRVYGTGYIFGVPNTFYFRNAISEYFQERFLTNNDIVVNGNNQDLVLVEKYDSTDGFDYEIYPNGNFFLGSYGEPPATYAVSYEIEPILPAQGVISVPITIVTEQTPYLKVATQTGGTTSKGSIQCNGSPVSAGAFRLGQGRVSIFKDAAGSVSYSESEMFNKCNIKYVIQYLNFVDSVLQSITEEFYESSPAQGATNLTNTRFLRTFLVRDLTNSCVNNLIQTTLVVGRLFIVANDQDAENGYLKIDLPLLYVRRNTGANTSVNTDTVVCNGVSRVQLQTVTSTWRWDFTNTNGGAAINAPVNFNLKLDKVQFVAINGVNQPGLTTRVQESIMITQGTANYTKTFAIRTIENVCENGVFKTIDTQTFYETVDSYDYSQTG